MYRDTLSKSPVVLEFNDAHAIARHILERNSMIDSRSELILYQDQEYWLMQRERERERLHCIKVCSYIVADIKRNSTT
jgi:hypothetical protein